MSTYKTTVGIEVHAELNTKSKMFCGCKNDPHASEPNTNICPICMAHPGTLPVVNKSAVEAVRKVGVAIGGTLSDFSEFDRKNYFYPDIPKAYQISQYENPLVTGGELAGVAITRIHLEEDTARSQHTSGEGSLVDFNRAGVPLMELVTEPVIHTPEEAGKFARELQLLLRMLGVSDANMEKGEMRVEANISVSNSRQLGTKVEVKNLNSFKVMEAAIAYETSRQISVLEEGGNITQETRGWNDEKGETYLQRTKESADDYRYFPDPDIPKYIFSEMPEMKESRISEILPKLATELRSVYRDIGLKEEQGEVILSSLYLKDYFEKVRLFDDSLSNEVLKAAANYLTSDVVNLVDDLSSLSLNHVAVFVELMKMVSASEINSRTAKDLLSEVVLEGISPAAMAKERGLLQLSSDEDLLEIVFKVITDNPAVVDEVRAGKEPALQFLVGQGMKASRGTANPKILADKLRSEILK